ncbi:hypothetical protein [Rubripirellula reticaptiva]|uniref:Uncharacterized protein n=1 Tax=Rubripirellula reticaptiva TaxID=2528013 RepID=A0A5C6EMH6_9BACT|nr:hypothetical protein [Rubripirellula reticaptiva]TWU49600.1 hypothetical protein Poly59_42170 [Rubripirellula reticaptiva]
MTESSDRDASSPTHGSNQANGSVGLGAKSGKRSSKSKVGGLAVIAMVAIYSFSAPRLNERFGWSLPAVKTDRAGNVRLADGDPKPTASRSTESKSLESSRPGQTANSGPVTSSSPSTSSSKFSPKPGPLSGKMPTGGQSPASTAKATTKPTANSSVPAQAKSVDRTDPDLEYGILREVSRDRFVSPAGLLYTPGSAEGHRLEHLRRHTEDDPGRPGSHGVFDGGMEGALTTIDRAFDRAKKKQKTTTTVDDGRTVYTVDMGGRVGYVGGRDGNRRRKPMARRVRLVVEGNRVITAYPM